MKIRNIIISVLASCSLFAGCVENQENMSFPSISMADKSVAFVSTDAPGQKVAFIANRAWKAVPSEAWIAVEPESGEGSNATQYVTVSVLDNTGFSRTGEISIDIQYDDALLAVSQEGPKGDAGDLILYSNDFDKVVATQTFGSSSSSWPYLDQFEGWKNETGAGIANITYVFNALSARANSASNGSYSDYDTASGNNNLLFGSGGYFVVKDIALNNFTTLKLSFGTEKYDANDKTALFTAEEFPVYVSSDNAKWTLLDYTYHGTTAGRWNIADVVFGVAEGTSSLSIYISSTKAGVHRLDDLKLEYSEEAGTLLDLTQGVELTIGSSTSGGSDSGSGDTNTAETATAVSVADFISKAETNTYYKLTGTVEGYTSGSYVQFDLKDGTGSVCVYKPTNSADFNIEDGGKITLAGKYKLYNTTHEVVDAVITEYTAPAAGEPKNYKKVSAVTSGKKYLIVAGGKYAAKGIASSSTAGYPGATEVTVSDDKISLAPRTEEMVITAVEGGYTIQQSDGRFWAQTGTGNTIYLQSSDTANGTVWTITAQEDGTMKILNNTSNHYLQYSESYNSYGSYEAAGGLLPVLYEVEGVQQMTATLDTDATLTGWAEDTDATYGKGYKVVSKGISVGFYAHEATSDISGYPNSNDGYFRVYKNGALKVSLTNGANIKKIVLEGSSSTYTKDLTVSDGTTAAKDGTTISWTGDVAVFSAVAAAGSVRIKSITVTYEN